MKRLLILSILIVVATASCAGLNKAGWGKPDFRQDQFKKDQEECIQTLGNGLDFQSWGETLEECLIKKGYKYYKYEISPRTIIGGFSKNIPSTWYFFLVIPKLRW